MHTYIHIHRMITMNIGKYIYIHMVDVYTMYLGKSFQQPSIYGKDIHNLGQKQTIYPTASGKSYQTDPYLAAAGISSSSRFSLEI